MLRQICIALAACFASSAAAQTPARSSPADAIASVPVRPYVSAFKDFRPYVDPEIARWREVNDEVGRLNGHMGHVPEAPRSAAKPAAKPAPKGADGGRK